MSPRARLLLVLASLVAVTALVQTTVVVRVPWPLGAAPDLVLLVVIAIGLATNPNLAAVAGFAAGLLLDSLPPDLTVFGARALVFSLIGYLAGSVGDPRGLAWVQLVGLLAGLAALSVGLQLGISMLLADRSLSAWSALGFLMTFTVLTALVGLALVPPLSERIRRRFLRAYPRPLLLDRGRIARADVGHE